MSERDLNIGIVSTRLAGTDGVSLEAAKWDQVLTELGHKCFYFAGEADRPADRTHIFTEAHFNHPLVRGINADLFSGNRIRMPETTDLIHEMRHDLKKAIREFVSEFDIQLLKVENALSLPMNVPLGLALTEFIAETNFPTVAHHHDFFWERERYSVSGAEDLLHAAFPPAMSSICHVVINTHAATELARRTGLRSTVVPNVMDFDNEHPAPGENSAALRERLDIGDDEICLLQPTRVVPRKCIERSIELAHWLERKATLVVSHASGDEGDDYQEYLVNYAKSMNVRLIFAGDLISHQDASGADPDAEYTLADAYHQADLVTYPSRVEGFGNAFLEAIYFRRPLMMGSYEIFKVDIEPKGFQVIALEDFVTSQTVVDVRRILEDSTFARQMADHNYQLAREHYSFTALRERLRVLFDQFRKRRSFSSFWS